MILIHYLLTFISRVSFQLKQTSLIVSVCSVLLQSFQLESDKVTCQICYLWNRHDVFSLWKCFDCLLIETIEFFQTLRLIIRRDPIFYLCSTHERYQANLCRSRGVVPTKNLGYVIHCFHATQCRDAFFQFLFHRQGPAFHHGQ